MNKKYLALSAAFIALAAQPLQITNLAHFADASVFASAEAGNGHGNGNGNGNGNSNGNGNGGSNGVGHGNSGANGNASAGGNGGDVSDNGSNTVDVASSIDNSGEALGQSKVKNLHAQLGRLNSLQRNINGIMKSHDPHLAAIRTFILNSVELAKAQTADAAAQAAYDSAYSAYTSAGLAGDPATTLATLQASLATAQGQAVVDQATIDSLNAQIAATNAVISAQTTLSAADAKVAQYEALTSDTALADALASSSNKNIGGVDVTQAMLDWSKSVLGVGDLNGAIDAYTAKFQ